MMGSLEAHQQVPDIVVTIRNGRYVITVRREARGVVGGIVHDTSSTGRYSIHRATCGDRSRESYRKSLRLKKASRSERILFALNGVVRPRHPALEAPSTHSSNSTRYTRGARFGEKFACLPVELCDPVDGFRINSGRHPLLVAQGVRVVPFDLTLNPDERTLLISGPNTAANRPLKAVALLSVLTHLGFLSLLDAIHVSAIVDNIFADIGERTVDHRKLSTFSAHVKILLRFLQVRPDRTLILIG